MDDFILYSGEKWEEETCLCRYCGHKFSKSEIDYCSVDCEEKDSVWNRIN